VPPLEGQRVHVLSEPIEEKLGLSAREQKELWQEWSERGPQGPIDLETSP
jgi:hypothetical protein